MTIQEVIAQFNTTPFLFVGSGLSRRYYSLPDWSGLLQHFSSLISNDRFAYSSYVNKAEQQPCSEGLMPAVASLIETDFNQKWFSPNSNIRSSSELVLSQVESGVSPFKAETAEFIRTHSMPDPAYQQEITKLKAISRQNIAGVITTNYDLFFEQTFSDYKVYVGQDELVFSPIQQIAEIYKIHGSVSQPETLVINENDYASFHKKGKYLAAKLMTIFMEYPIIFIGYSLSDSNIQNILSDIVECLPASKVSSLQKRFIFIDYVPGTSVSVSAHSMSLHGRLLQMTKISLADFALLYDALAAKKAAFPIKLLRRFKQDLYSFAITSQPCATLKVAPLDDSRVSDDQLAITIGLAQTGVYGLARSVNTNQWYRNIVMNDLSYSCDDLLEYAYPELNKGNGKLPVHKYLAHANKDFPLIKAEAQSYTDIVSPTANSTLNARSQLRHYHSAMDIWADLHESNFSKAIRLIGFMPEEKVDAQDLKFILETIFKDNADILETLSSTERSPLRKVIRMYDYLMWGK